MRQVRSRSRTLTPALSRSTARGSKNAARLRNVLGQPSWSLANELVHAFVTRTGGHLGPVTFKLGSRRVEPYSVAPWHGEKLDPSQPPVIRALRGDFFCMPFGGNASRYRKEQHPVHGEVANAKWSLRSLRREGDRTLLHLSLRTRVRRARVDKIITLIRGHRAIYARHIVSGASGPMCLGQHAMLRFPDEPASGAISTSPFVYGRVFPEPLERPENRGYSFLEPGAEFDSLERVQLTTGEFADLSRYPARRGFEDLVLMASDDRAPFAWTAVTFPAQRYVWLALKDPRVLRSTILWISNGGRHYPPWSGRHVNVMGLEEVTANFHYGLKESVAPNPLSKRGIATTVMLDPRRPLVVNYIMAVAEVPRAFDRVVRVEAEQESVRVTSGSGKSVRVPLDVSFLNGGGA